MHLIFTQLISSNTQENQLQLPIIWNGTPRKSRKSVRSRRRRRRRKKRIRSFKIHFARSITISSCSLLFCAGFWDCISSQKWTTKTCNTRTRNKQIHLRRTLNLFNPQFSSMAIGVE